MQSVHCWVESCDHHLTILPHSQVEVTGELLKLQTYERLFQRLVATQGLVPIGIYRTIPTSSCPEIQKFYSETHYKDPENVSRFLKSRLHTLGLKDECKYALWMHVYSLQDWSTTNWRYVSQSDFCSSSCQHQLPDPVICVAQPLPQNWAETEWCHVSCTYLSHDDHMTPVITSTGMILSLTHISHTP